MTDVEFAEMRYSGRPAAALRGFRALYLAIPINLIILGWVTRAMIKILTISLGLRDVQLAGLTISGEVLAVGICFVITVAYSAGAGMWAVLWTDLVQFVIKMTAVIVLAVFAVRAVGGMDELKAGLGDALRQLETAALSVLPVKIDAERAGGVRVDAAARARGVPLGAVVGGLVSGRRAGRRRLRGAAHLLGEDGARRRAGDALLPGRALRASVRGRGSSPASRRCCSTPTASARRTIRKRPTCRRSSICCRRRGAAS